MSLLILTLTNAAVRGILQQNMPFSVKYLLLERTIHSFLSIFFNIAIKLKSLFKYVYLVLLINNAFLYLIHVVLQQPQSYNLNLQANLI